MQAVPARDARERARGAAGRRDVRRAATAGGDETGNNPARGRSGRVRERGGEIGEARDGARVGARTR